MIHITDDKLDQLLAAIHHAAKREEPCEYGLPVACGDWMALARVEVRDWLGGVMATAVDDGMPAEQGMSFGDTMVKMFEHFGPPAGPSMRGKSYLPAAIKAARDGITGMTPDEFSASAKCTVIIDEAGKLTETYWRGEPS